MERDIAREGEPDAEIATTSEHDNLGKLRKDVVARISSHTGSELAVLILPSARRVSAAPNPGRLNLDLGTVRCNPALHNDDGIHLFATIPRLHC